MTFPETTARKVVLILLLAQVVAVRAEDWPQWRGPKRDGVWSETGVLEKFPAGGLKVRWRAPVGMGLCTPVVSGGRVYVTDSQLTRPKAHERVLAFDEKTGRTLWTHSYEVDYPEWAYDGTNPIGPRATPVILDGKLYTLGIFGQILCLDLKSGAVAWQLDLAKAYRGVHLECTASPLIDGDLFIVCVGAKPNACVIAFDKNDGKIVWTALDDSAAFSSPIIIQAGGVRQLIVWTLETVTALDPAAGKTLWRQRFNRSSDFPVSTPVLQGNLLLISGLMLKLDPDKSAAAPLWKPSRALPDRILSNTSTALFQGDYFYSAKSSGELVCVRSSTGKQVWQTDKVTALGRGASIHLTPNGQSVLLFTDRGDLIRAHLAPDGYKEITRTHLLEPTFPLFGRNFAWAPPAFANQQIFARNDKELICASLAVKP
jgi:outer membrane protein assembly factor BamB